MASTSDHCYDVLKIPLSAYATNLTNTLQRGYVEKLKFQCEDGSGGYFADPYLISEEKWTKDQSLWPDVTDASIKNYFMDARGDSTSTCLKQHKPLGAHIYVQEVKGEVRPSQKTNESSRLPWIIMDGNGVVKAAHCTCMAGFGETCSHVAALMYGLEEATRCKKKAPTDSICKWNNSFSKNVASLPLDHINLSASRKIKKAKYERKVNVCSPLEGVDVTKENFEQFRLIQPAATFFHAYADSSETESGSEEEEELPPTMEKLFSVLGFELDRAKSYFSREKCIDLEQATQSQGELWLSHKAGRLTSSNFSEVLKRKKQWADNFGERILFPKNLSSVPQIKWGKTKEKVALADYLEVAKRTHTELQFRPAGLFVDEEYPYLGASPDGVVSCSCCGEGVIEIKCPYKHKDLDPKSISSVDRSFCLDEHNDLKDTHPYFYQVQGQMALCRVPYCDFIIWTKKDLLVQRIYSDRVFWEGAKSNLICIFKRYCFPFLQKKFCKS